MKKGIFLGLMAVVFLLIIGLVLSLVGVFNPVLQSLGITGNPVISDDELPNYPVINTTITKNGNGNYTVSWTLLEEPEDPSWTPLILKTHVTTKSNGATNYETLLYGQQSKNIVDTPPISYLINFTLDIKHGGIIVSSEGNCRPQFIPTNGTSGPGAWYDFCMTNPISLKNAAVTPTGYPFNYSSDPITKYYTTDAPYCCYENSNPGEGWYNDTCADMATWFPTDINCTGINCQAHKVTDNLSRADPCTLGEYAVYYEMKSAEYAIFEQNLTTPSTNTSINWFTKLDFREGDEATSGDLLEYDSVDYVSRWDSSAQRYYGSAEGIAGGGSPVVIGSFNLDQGKPYFISMGKGTPGSSMILSYTGLVPGHVTFNLKADGSGYNYINLPLDTTIDKLSELCASLIGAGLINSNSGVTRWNPTIQNYEDSEDCNAITNDWDLTVGRVYRVYANTTGTWNQI